MGFLETFHHIATSFVSNEIKKKKIKAVSIRIYLNSLNHYLQFVKLSKVSALSKPGLDSEIQSRQDQVKRWIKALQKQVNEEVIEKQIKDQGMCWFTNVQFVFSVRKGPCMIIMIFTNYIP